MIKSIAKALTVATLLGQANLSYASLAEIAQKENVVNQLSSSFYRYEDARDRYFLGDRGLVNQASVFQASVQTWVNTWKNWDDSFSANDLSLSAAGTSIQSFLRAKQTELESIRNQLDGMKNIRNSIGFILSQNEGITKTDSNEVYLAQLSSSQNSLLRNADGLIAQSEALSDSLTLSLIHI